MYSSSPRDPSSERPDESFWPSFTDVMMVVMMIFLIISTFLILRNTELFSSLLQSQEANRQADLVLEQQLLTQLGLEGEKQDLTERLQKTLNLLERTLAERARLGREVKANKESIAELESTRKYLLAQLAEERGKSRGLSGEVAALSDEVGSQKLRVDELLQEISLLTTNLEQTNRDREALTELLGVRTQELEEALASAASLQNLNVELAERLARAEVALSTAEAEDQFGRAQTDITALRNALEEEQARLRQTLTQKNEALAEIKLIRQQIAITRGQTGKSELDLKSAREELEKLRQASGAEVSDQLSDIGRLTQEQLRQLREQYGALRSDYENLQKEYDRVKRPARSPVDKQVAIIILHRALPTPGGRSSISIEYQAPGWNRPEPITPRRLHFLLSELRERLGDQLYVLLRLPESEEISYGEALAFRREFVERYDYYYQ